MGVLHTYIIPFLENPPVYEEGSDKSAPLTMSKKIDRDGKIKNRICKDGTRSVNLFIKLRKVVHSKVNPVDALSEMAKRPRQSGRSRSLPPIPHQQRSAITSTLFGY
jgi:hypothetical protein